ncbi:rna-directed dna polymerase from mobile element jockey-like [Willisornis vidua]|uniref:Rna-directed dna polymerase from mobile element jockey-like n=1 Tax=Willisornis vidua TaxID=1566151 RepID=A0ABQ9DPR4_9PASS|nr:rna-directed dna polymerase from mobile element jockey-like [Willisornis vidua]
MPFWRDRQGKRGGEVALYVRESLASVEIKISDNKVESLWVTCLVEEGKAVDVVCLDFSKAFDTVSHNMLLEKLAAHSLDMEGTLCWVRSWLEGPESAGEWSCIQLAAGH